MWYFWTASGSSVTYHLSWQLFWLSATKNTRNDDKIKIIKNQPISHQVSAHVASKWVRGSSTKETTKNVHAILFMQKWREKDGEKKGVVETWTTNECLIQRNDYGLASKQSPCRWPCYWGKKNKKNKYSNITFIDSFQHVRDVSENRWRVPILEETWEAS